MLTTFGKNTDHLKTTTDEKRFQKQFKLYILDAYTIN